MKKIYTVTQVNAYIRGIISNDYALRIIRVEGEVSNCKYHNSGHIYFTIKDENAAISAVMFAGSRSGLGFRLEDGIHVIVSGNIDVYEKSGIYQIYAKQIEKAGKGDLFERFIALKNELEEMGMFSAEYKKPIPVYAHRIGIVTAKEGAALQDIINISKRRNPFVSLILCPATVQGEKAADSIVEGIQRLNEYGADIIIVGRGGGSIEDLWAFNEEKVARAIFESRIPVISAVGHETDFTIADFVADLRAPTPSAAAELATADILSLLYTIDIKGNMMKEAMYGRIKDFRILLKEAEMKFARLSPAARIADKRYRLAEAQIQMKNLMDIALQQKKQKLLILSKSLTSLSPGKMLSSGYAFVTDEKYRRIHSASLLKQNDEIILRFADGSVKASVKEVLKDERTG